MSDVLSHGVNSTSGNANLFVDWTIEGDALEKNSVSFKNNTFTAVKTGAATVVIKDRKGNDEARFEVTVLSKEEKETDKSQNTTFKLTGRTQKLKPSLPVDMRDPDGVYLPNKIFKLENID